MINIIVGTETGTAEYVADEIVNLLNEHRLDASITLTADLNELIESNYWIICTSTHGAGDVPNNLQPLLKQLEQNKADLSQIKFIIIALGDSSYDTYCQAGKTIQDILIKQHAQPLANIIEIDAMDDDMPEDIAIEQLKNIIEKLN